jgi:hypothetical protein
MLPRLPRRVAIRAIARRGGDYQQSDVFTVVRGLKVSDVAESCSCGSTTSTSSLVRAGFRT